MISSSEVKEFVIRCGADKCGIASVERFEDAPKGFHPADIYPDCRSVVVFLKRMPSAVILATNPVPYTHTAYLLYAELDRLGLKLCHHLENKGIHAIPVPTDVPYIAWDENRKHGQAILSMRHSAYNAGLGILGRNTLLINPDFGNMVYIGAVLIDSPLDPDPIEENLSCPPNCRICLDACPQHALDGITVNQKICREVSFYKNARGFDIYDCNACRRSCLLRNGKKRT